MDRAFDEGVRDYGQAQRNSRFSIRTEANPYALRPGLANEAWAWDLGWRLARFLARGEG